MVGIWTWEMARAALARRCQFCSKRPFRCPIPSNGYLHISKRTREPQREAPERIYRSCRWDLNSSFILVTVAGYILPEERGGRWMSAPYSLRSQPTVHTRVGSFPALRTRASNLRTGSYRDERARLRPSQVPGPVRGRSDRAPSGAYNSGSADSACCLPGRATRRCRA